MKRAEHMQRDGVKSGYWVGLVVVLAIVVSISIAFFLRSNYKQIMQQNTRYMENTATQTAYRIDDILQNAERAITTVADLYGKTMDSAVPNMTTLKEVADDTLFDFVEYVDSNGMDWTTDGKTADVSDREYFKKGMAGETGIDVVFNSRITNETLIVFYAPLYYHDEIAGVLKGHYREDRMQHIMEENYFGEKAVSYLCKPDGTIIARSGEASVDTDDIREIFVDDKLGEHTRDTFLESLANGESCSFTFEGQAGTTAGYLAQLSGIDWSVVQIFPSFETAQMMQRVQYAAMLLMLELAAVFAAYVLLIVTSSKARAKRLESENAEIMQIVQGVNRLFTRFIVINFDEDSYYYLEDYSTMPSRIPRKGRYTDFVSHFEDRILETTGDTPMEEVLPAQCLQRLLGADNYFVRYEFLIRREKADRWEDAAFICLSRRDGVPVSVLFAIQDVTELKQAEAHKREVLQEAFRVADDANHAKSDFLSRMSHDIRTPMNAIMGMTAIASMHVDEPDKVKDCLDKISVSGGHLLSLINEVLDMSKIESGSMTLSEHMFSMAKCLKDVLDMFSMQIEEKHLELVLKDADTEHDLVSGDEERLKRILLNILGNAVKFTPDGGRITLDAQERPGNAAGSACFKFICEDTGIGMDEGLKNRIFEPFTRARDSRTEKTEGSGLGLPIARSIAKLMGGDIAAESEPGKGSRFTVSVMLKVCESDGCMDGACEGPDDAAGSPGDASGSSGDASGAAAENESGAAGAAAENYGPAGFEGKKVLLVEDNELNTEIALEFLSQLKVEADVAANGQLAVEKLLSTEECPYDMVLMDIQMPVMNGYEAARTIRASGRSDLEGIPIVAITADAFLEDVNRAKAAGMNDHLSKPISIERLSKVLERWT